MFFSLHQIHLLPDLLFAYGVLSRNKFSQKQLVFKICIDKVDQSGSFLWRGFYQYVYHLVKQETHGPQRSPEKTVSSRTQA